MKYRETLPIRPQCASCPMIERLEDIYELGQEIVTESSHESIVEKLRKDLFDQLLADGTDIEVAATIVSESEADMNEFATHLMKSTKYNMQAVVSLGHKLMISCRPEGLLLTKEEPRTYVCMSKLALAMAGNTANSPRP